jgi:hypothetical protein
METGRRCLKLTKGRHRYVFRYREGQEPCLLGALVELAERPDVDLDWLDAARLAYQMGKRIGVAADRPAAFSP